MTIAHPILSQTDDVAAPSAALAASWADAWNRHDMDAAAILVAPEIEFVTVAGLWLRGRDEFLKHHRHIHEMQMRDSQWVNLAISQRPIQNDLVLIHLEWRITGDRELDGTPRQPRHGLFTWLAAPVGQVLRILAAHNTNLRPDLRHRLSRSAGTNIITGENP
jgi:uncharacterized protein (TIGR02246 family)